MNTTALIVGLAVALLPTDAPRRDATQAGVTMTFVANAGVMLSAGNSKVLIDALFREYDGYPIAADSTRDAIEAARAPFDGVDLVLVTHRHGDHFHPASVARHLESNPGAVLFTSRQVVDSMRKGASSHTVNSQRVLPRTTPPPTRSVQIVNGVVVELLGLPHGGRRHRAVEHLAYIVNIGGRRVLHTGDAELSEETLRPFRLDTARIDVAILPSWIVAEEEGRAVVQRWIRPKQVVAVHLSNDGETDARQLATHMPGVISFWRSLDVRTW
jgi:L-ascorbate metabolism protein UlaG (beta-lactamase superfamily)